ncbi:trans-sialidase [Trypanosoma cruzi]|nr:trans-sialidase [Trypanosoma cruzi]
MGEDPLPRVALCVISCFVCDIVLWRAESSYARTGSTAMVFVCEGWCGVAGQREDRGDSFPEICFFRVCCAASCFSPVILSSSVPAWSGRMLTGHVDCECLLTASIHLPLSLPLPVCHSLLGVACCTA